MDAEIPSIGDEPVTFGFVGIATAVEEVKFYFIVFRHAVFPFEFAYPGIVGILFAFYKFFEFGVCLFIGTKRRIDRNICIASKEVCCVFYNFPSVSLPEVIDMDMFLSGNAVLKVQAVFIGEQVIIRYDNFSAFCDGNGGFAAVGVQFDDVEDNIVFTVEVLEFFEIKFVHMKFSFQIFSR